MSVSAQTMSDFTKNWGYNEKIHTKLTALLKARGYKLVDEGITNFVYTKGEVEILVNTERVSYGVKFWNPAGMVDKDGNPVCWGFDDSSIIIREEDGLDDLIAEIDRYEAWFAANA